MSESERKAKQEYLADLVMNGLNQVKFNQYLVQLKGKLPLTS
jgi:hypothetical protein